MSSAGREPTLPTGAPSASTRGLKSSRYGSGVLELDQRPRICEVAVDSNFCLLKRDLVPRHAPMAFWFNYDRVSDRVFKLPSCGRSRIPRVRVRQI